MAQISAAGVAQVGGWLGCPLLGLLLQLGLLLAAAP
jgi:hypothetical protein